MVIRIQTWNNDFNSVDEDITSVYAEYAWKGETGWAQVGGTWAGRHEETDVTADRTPSGARWTWSGSRDNEFAGSRRNPGKQPLPEEGDYDNVLPTSTSRSNCLDNVVRSCFVGARPSRVRITDNCSPPTPPAHLRGQPPSAGIAPARSNNTALVPLESSEYRYLVEVYYSEASYVSIGILQQGCRGNSSVRADRALVVRSSRPELRCCGNPFGAGIGGASLNNPGRALRNDVNMFVLTARIDTWRCTIPNPRATFLANSTNGVSSAGLRRPDHRCLGRHWRNAARSVLPVPRCPARSTRMSANIHGVEFAFQHFFGESGFGIPGNYTFVDGDVGINVCRQSGRRAVRVGRIERYGERHVDVRKVSFTARRFLQLA